jgi:hypothetical protein
VSNARALLIGNSTFPEDPHNLPDLHGPVNDLPLLRDALTDPKSGIFEPTKVRLLPERAKRDITTAMEDLMRRAGPDDLVLVYYSGHGKQDQYDNLYLCARDTRSDLLLSTAISDAEINGMMRSSSAKTFVIILDCCHSGAFKSGGLPAKLRGSGRFLLTSSRNAELSADASDVSGPSAFTRCLVDALQSGTVDADEDGYVSLSDIYDYVLDHLRGDTGQIPQRHFDHAVGDVVLARVPGQEGVRMPPLPQTEPPVLELSETSIEIHHVQPGESLPPQTVDVFNRGGGELDWVAESDASWIEVERVHNSIRLQFALQPGTNRGNVHVRDRGGGGSRTVRVTVQVLPRPQAPRLNLSTTSLDFGILSVGAEPSSRSVQLFNLGGSALNVRTWTDEPWIRLRTEDDVLHVSIDTAWTGDLRGEIHVATDGGEGRIAVAARVGAGPVLSVPASLDFGAVSPGNRQARMVPVRNAGAGQLSWHLGQSGDFFVARGTRLGIEVRLTGDRRPGRHAGSFWLRSNGGDAVIEVTATVVEPRSRTSPLRSRMPALVASAAVLLALAVGFGIHLLATPSPKPRLVPPALAADPVGAVSRKADLIDIFWIGPDRKLYASYYNGGWYEAQSPSQTVADAAVGSPLAVVAPQPDALNVFWRRDNGSMGSAAYPDQTGGWGKAIDFMPAGSVRRDSSIVATTSDSSTVTVLWVDPKGAIRAGRGTAPGSSIAVASRAGVATGSNLAVVTRPDQVIEVFWVGHDGAVETVSRQNGVWQPQRQLAGPNSADPSTGVAAAALPTGDHVQVFWARSGSVYTRKEDPGGWSRVSMIRSGGIQPGTPLTAAAVGSHVHAFWVQHAGLIHYTDATNRTEPASTGGNAVSSQRPGLVAFAQDGEADVVWVTARGEIAGRFHNVGTSDPVVVASPGSVPTR